MATEASPTSTIPIRCVMETAVSSQRAEAASQIFWKEKKREGEEEEEKRLSFFFPSKELDSLT